MLNSIPKDCWSRKFNDKEPDSSVHSPAVPPVLDIIKLLPIAYRLSNHIAHERKNKKEPIFDLNGLTLQPPNPGPHAGVPLGGIGGGSIGRGFKGEFRRWSLQPGKYVHKAIVSDLFSVRVNRNGKISSVILSLLKPDEHSCLTNWNWNMSPNCGSYSAVYPRSWTVYEDPLPNIRVIVKQVSPFIPDNYSDSSLPAAVFEIEVENKSYVDDIDVSIMFTFQNGLDADCQLDRYLTNFQHHTFQTSEENKESSSVYGISMHHTTTKTYVRSSKESEDIIQSDDLHVTTDESIAATEQLVHGMTTTNFKNEPDFVAKESGNSLCSVLLSEAEQFIEKKITDHVSIAVAAVKTSTNKITSCKQFISRPSIPFIPMFDCQMGSSLLSAPSIYDSSNEWNSADELWLQFHNTGEIKDFYFSKEKLAEDFESDEDSIDPEKLSKLYQCQRRYSSAICVKETILRGNKKTGNFNRCNFQFSLAWDYPIARFGSGKGLPRYYTKFFQFPQCQLGNNASILAIYALQNYSKWDTAIQLWQDTVRNELSPSKLNTERELDEEEDQLFHENRRLNSPLNAKKSLLAVPRDSSYYSYHIFNELYYLADGGTFWLDSCNGINNQLYFPTSSLSGTSVPGVAGSGVISSNDYEGGEQHVTINLNSFSPQIMKRGGISETIQLKDESEEKTDQLNEKLLGSSDETTEEQNIVKALRRLSATEINQTIPWSLLEKITEKMVENNRLAKLCCGNQKNIGQFLYLEGHEYLMYNTYDVHFYASYALIMLFPQLELSLQKDILLSVNKEDLMTRQMMGEGNYCIRKRSGVVPHDVGSPSEEPWKYCNAYNFQDVSNWKDLGSKFILQVYRNYHYMKTIYLQKLIQMNSSPEEIHQYQQLLFTNISNSYPILLKVIQTMEELFDLNKDGMIENSGFPDQTYDIWIAKGVHAYCGGLWITACTAIKELSILLQDTNTTLYYSSLIDKAKQIYLQELWNGLYLNYDNSNSSHHDSIMADMLAGQWYARSCSLSSPISAGHAYSCLKIIYEYNVLHFGKGEYLGAVNGMRPDTTQIPSLLASLAPEDPSSFQYHSFSNGNNSNNIRHPSGSQSLASSSSSAASSLQQGQYLVASTHLDGEIDQSCLQSREVWTGTTYALAATMLQEAFFNLSALHEQEAKERDREQHERDDNSHGIHVDSMKSENEESFLSTKKTSADPYHHHLQYHPVGAIGSDILTELQRKDLIEMAYHTAKGIHDAGWQKFGYWFATPEAWEVNGHYRSLGYMRALSIWSMQYAREQYSYENLQNLSKK